MRLSVCFGSISVANGGHFGHLPGNFSLSRLIFTTQSLSEPARSPHLRDCSIRRGADDKHTLAAGEPLRKTCRRLPDFSEWPVMILSFVFRW